MNRLLLLSALGISLFSSCSTAFKSGQTPDDVYYSPGREIAAAKEQVVREKDQAAYDEYISSQDDRYLHMKVANRSRWNSLDDFDYWYDSRYDFCNYNNYSYYNPWINRWNISIGYGSMPYFGNYGWGWNNPFYTVVYYAAPKTSFGGYTTGSNISAYRNRNYSNSNYSYKDPKTGTYISNSNSNNFGNLLKRVFTTSPNNGGTSTSFDRPARTFSTPSNNQSTNSTPSTSSSAGGHSGGYSSTGSSSSTGRGGRG